MSFAVELMNPESKIETPVILESLPTPALNEEGCPRRTRLQIDLLLLAIESLELGTTETMLEITKQLELDSIITHRVMLWKIRSSNPIRIGNRRRRLTIIEAKALVVIICYLARRLTSYIRELLLAYQQLSEKQIPVEHHFRLSEFLIRFRSHFRSRMNPKRALVMNYQSNEKLNQLALSLLSQLLFCTGTSGMQRLWISLFDGEVL